MKGKRILIAAMASLCVAACAAGITACAPDPESGRDPALNAAYQTYVSQTEEPKSYDEWVADLLDKLAAGGTQGNQGEQGETGERGDDGDDGIDGENGRDGEDGVSIIDVKIIELNGKQYFEFTFSNGKIIRISTDGEERQETTSFTVTCLDNNGNPVENAYFNVGYADTGTTQWLKKDGTTGTSSSEAYAAKSNSKGIATFFVFPQNTSAAYSVYIADPYSISADGNTNGIPKGYTVNFGWNSQLGMANNSSPFTKGGDGNYTAAVNFKVDYSWNSVYESTDALAYKRYYADLLNPTEVTEINTPYTKKVIKDSYNYFTFNPYRQDMPSGELTQEQTDSIIKNAREAASGVYRFSWKASKSGADVKLVFYNFQNGSYFVKKADGSPAESLVLARSGSMPNDKDALDAAYNEYAAAEGSTALGYDVWLQNYSSTFTGKNYVDVLVESDEASATFCFGFVSDTNCDVTISVERIGNAPKWTDVYNEEPMPTNAPPAFPVEGRITDVPLNSVVVRDNSGKYHVGSASGPQIYVQLNNPTRVNQNSMVYLSAYTTGNDGADGSVVMTMFDYTSETFDESTNSGVRTHTDYSNVVKGYGALANSDGLYPVNDLLKTVLENFCKNYRGWNEYDEYWVAACYYYGPVSDGSESAPYDLSSDETTVTLNGSQATYVAFRASSSAYYEISSTDATIGGLDGAVDIDGRKFVYFQALEEKIFTVTGSGTAHVSVFDIRPSQIIEYSIDRDAIEYGTDESPLQRSGNDVFQVNIDHNAHSGKIAVDFKAATLMDGDYTITVYGSSTATIVKEGNQSVIGQTVTLSSSEALRLWFDDTEDGTFFIKVTKNA